jgi:hypothetical protein
VIPIRPDEPAAVLVSLDSKLFTREWVRSALALLLAEHGSLMFLLADDLLRYTRTGRSFNGDSCLDFSQVSSKAEHRYEEVRRFLASEIRRLDPAAQERVRVSRWRDFTDSRYVGVLRSLHIAYACVGPWRECVEGVARGHLERSTLNMASKGLLDCSSRLILDEVAMCLRVTELDVYHCEYYPGVQIAALEALYSDRFVSHGLSVESLIEKGRSRKFESLTIESISSRFTEGRPLGTPLASVMENLP